MPAESSEAVQLPLQHLQAVQWQAVLELMHPGCRAYQSVQRSMVSLIDFSRLVFNSQGGCVIVRTSLMQVVTAQRSVESCKRLLYKTLTDTADLGATDEKDAGNANGYARRCSESR